MSHRWQENKSTNECDDILVGRALLWIPCFNHHLKPEAGMSELHIEYSREREYGDSVSTNLGEE